jgi:hypothetical protein
LPQLRILITVVATTVMKRRHSISNRETKLPDHRPQTAGTRSRHCV